MTLMLYFMLMVAATLTLFLAVTPISLGFNILVMALILSVNMAAYMSSWLAFLVFLIYIGGMLVMFAYFLALCPNQQMMAKSSVLYILMTLMTLFMMVLVTNMQLIMPLNSYQSTYFMYYLSNSSMLIILATVLLLTMVIVVKLTYLSKGPLRPFYYV